MNPSAMCAPPSSTSTRHSSQPDRASPFPHLKHAHLCPPIQSYCCCLWPNSIGDALPISCLYLMASSACVSARNALQVYLRTLSLSPGRRRHGRRETDRTCPVERRAAGPPTEPYLPRDCQVKVPLKEFRNPRQGGQATLPAPHQRLRCPQAQAPKTEEAPTKTIVKAPPTGPTWELKATS